MSSTEPETGRERRVANKAARAINRLHKDQSACSSYLRTLMPAEGMNRIEFKWYMDHSSKDEYHELLTNLWTPEKETVLHKACAMEEKRNDRGLTYAPMIDEETARKLYDMLEVKQILNVSFEKVRTTMEKNAVADASKPPPPPSSPPKTSKFAELGAIPIRVPDAAPLKPSRTPSTRKPLLLSRDKNSSVKADDKGKRKRKSEPSTQSTSNSKAEEPSKTAPAAKKQKRGDVVTERLAARQASQSSAGATSKPSAKAVAEAQRKAEKNKEKNKRKRERNKLKKSQAETVGQVLTPAQPSSTSDDLEAAQPSADSTVSASEQKKPSSPALEPSLNEKEDAKAPNKRHGKSRNERRKAKKALETALEQKEKEDTQMIDASVAEDQPTAATAPTDSENVENAAANAAKVEAAEQLTGESDRPKRKVRRSRHKSRAGDADTATVEAEPAKEQPDLDVDNKTKPSPEISEAPEAVQELPRAVSHTALPLKPSKSWEVTAGNVSTAQVSSSRKQSPSIFDSLTDHLDGPAVGLEGKKRFSPQSPNATERGVTHESNTAPVPKHDRSVASALSSPPSLLQNPASSIKSSLGQMSFSSQAVKPRLHTASIKPSRLQGKASSIPEYDDTQDIRANFRKFSAVLKGKNVEDLDSDDSSDDESSSSSDSDSDAGPSIQPSQRQNTSEETQPLHDTKEEEEEDKAPVVTIASPVPFDGPPATSSEQQSVEPDVTISGVLQETEMMEAPASMSAEEERVQQSPSEEEEEDPVNTFDPEAVEFPIDTESLVMRTTEPQDPILTFSSIHGSISPSRSQISPTPMLPDLPELMSYGGYVPQSDDSDVGSVRGDDSKMENEVEIDLMSYLPDDTETPRFVRPSAIEYSSPPAPHMSEHGSDIEMEAGGDLDLHGSVRSASASIQSINALQNAPQVPTLRGTADTHREPSPSADVSSLEELVVVLSQEKPDIKAEHSSKAAKRASHVGPMKIEGKEDVATVNSGFMERAVNESPSRHKKIQSGSNDQEGPTTPLVIIERMSSSERSLYRIHKENDFKSEPEELEGDEDAEDSDADSVDSSPVSELSHSPSPVENKADRTPEDSEHEKEEEVEESKPKTKKKRKMTGTKSKHFTPSPAKKPRVPAGMSAVPFPKLSASRFGLIQEELSSSPFRLLLAVTFLNKTKGKTAVPVYRQLMERYPTAKALASADESEVSSMIYSLGFQNQRARKLIRQAQSWLDRPPQKGKRYRTRDYPLHGDGRQLKPNDIVEEDADDVAGALEIGHMYGLGPYAWDSWRIFCRDVFRGVATGYNGEGVPGYAPPAPAASPVKPNMKAKLKSETSCLFEPEWKRVVPLDKELRACLRWMWLREGWEWDPLTGNRHPASVEAMREASAGDATWEEPNFSSPAVVKMETKETEAHSGPQVKEDVDAVAVSSVEVPGGSASVMRRSSRLRRVNVKDEQDSSEEDNDGEQEDGDEESDLDEALPMDVDDSFEDPDYGDESS